MCSSIFVYLHLTAKYPSIREKAAECTANANLELQNVLGSKARNIEKPIRGM